MAGGFGSLIASVCLHTLTCLHETGFLIRSVPRRSGVLNGCGVSAKQKLRTVVVLGEVWFVHGYCSSGKQSFRRIRFLVEAEVSDGYGASKK